MNHSDKDRTIVSATTPAAGKVELHDVIVDGDVMKMRQVQEILKSLRMVKRYLNLAACTCLFDLKDSLKEDEQIEMTLTFANGETQTFDAPVKKVMSGMKKMNHDH